MLNPVRFQQERTPLSLLRVPIPIDVVQVQTTATDIFTAAAGTEFHIMTLFASNHTATADFITLHLVPALGSAGVTNRIVYEKAIPAKDYVAIFSVETPMILQEGYTLQGLDGVDDSVNVWGWGYQYQGDYGA